MAGTEVDELEPGALAETLEAVAKAEESKKGRKVLKREAKAVKRAAKRERKATRKAAKAAAKATKEAIENGEEAPGVTVVAPEKKEPRITAKKASNAISVGKVVLPAVLPVVMPYAIRAANAAREAYERQKARRLGVSVDSLGEYGGHGAALHARIAGLSDSMAELRRSSDPAKARFAEDAGPTLQQLSTAVRAAERMPAARRKQAHQAVSAELDGLENRLLQHLGV